MTSETILLLVIATLLAVNALSFFIMRKSERPAAATDHVVIVTDVAPKRTLVTLPCGAEIVELEPHDIADTPCAIDRHQPDSVRNGGIFFQCYGRCPFASDCTYLKTFADLHLGEDVSLPLEHGKRLELKRGNGHRHVALVDESNVETKDIALTGVTFLNCCKRYSTVPPLFQDVEEPAKE